MKIICFSGNLGNQVFYCAFKDYLLKKNPKEKVYKYVIRWCPPVTVEKYFNLKAPESNKWANAVSCIIFYLEIILMKFLRIKLPSSIVCGRGKINEDALFFSNYLQDKYFYEHRDSSWLQINMPNILSDDYLRYEKMIKESDSICVHIRRGDYIKPGSAYVDLSSTNYYQSAIELARKKYPKGKLFFFSDDLSFAKDHFGDASSVYVDCNRGVNSYLDIKLMSLGKVNIMANSTFSYWGAYMGHEYKTIFCPKAWFRKETGRQAPDIMLDSWIKI